MGKRNGGKSHPVVRDRKPLAGTDDAWMDGRDHDAVTVQREPCGSRPASCSQQRRAGEEQRFASDQ
jgi:hypothetical protein